MQYEGLNHPDYNPNSPGSSQGIAVGRSRVGETLARHQPPLEEFNQLILGQIENVYSLAAKLRVHADRVHGPRPENVGKDSCPPMPEGMIWIVRGNLERLNEATEALSAEVDRNCNLA